MIITNKEKATINKFKMKLPKDEGETIVNLANTTTEAVLEAMTRKAFRHFEDAFKRIGWKIENFRILNAKYSIRQLDLEGTYKILVKEVELSFDLIPTEQARILELETDIWLGVRLDEIPSTGLFGVMDVVGLALVGATALFFWLAVREVQVLISNVVVSPYGGEFFRSFTSIVWALVIGFIAYIFWLIYKSR